MDTYKKLSMTHIFPKISNRQFATWGPCIRTPKRALHECSHLNRLTSFIGQFCSYLSWCSKLKLVPLTCLLDSESVRELHWPLLNFCSPCLASCWQQKPAIFHPFCGFCFFKSQCQFPKQKLDYANTQPKQP